VLVAVVASDADADGAVLEEVHAVGGVPLPYDQLAVDQRAWQQRVRQVGALVRLEQHRRLISSFVNSLIVSFGESYSTRVIRFGGGLR
jgi:hypothetical protein